MREIRVRSGRFVPPWHRADPGEEREGRRLRWLKYKAALRRLTYEETQDLLRAAWPRIKTAVAARPRASRKKR